MEESTLLPKLLNDGFDEFELPMGKNNLNSINKMTLPKNGPPRKDGEQVTEDNKGRIGPGREELKPKPCQYVGCKKWYRGTGFSKYCMEHRKREYHKPIKSEKKEDNVNLKYEHIDIESSIVTMKCNLDGCKKEYQVQILPGVFVYPRYCEEHRNEHKRKIFLNKGADHGRKNSCVSR